MKKADTNTTKDHRRVITTRSVVVMLGEIGFVIAVPLIFFVFIGHSLDVRMGTKVTFLFIGIAIALASSVNTLYSLYKNLQK